jgi:ribose transport system permease protein
MAVSDTAQLPKKKPPERGVLEKIIRYRELGILIPFVVMVVTIGLIKPVLFSANNMRAIVRGLALFGICAVGETMVILTGEFDVSVGSIAGLGAVLSTWFSVRMHIPPVLAISMALVACCGVGMINGLVVVKMKIKAFIATIAMLYAARGMCFVITKGYPVYPIPKVMQDIGSIEPFGTSISFVLFLALVVLFEWVLRSTVYGRNVFATGTDERVANLVGIDAAAVKISAFVLSGFFAGLAGILLACQLRSGLSDIGRGWELFVIAAIAVGGISLYGGAGSMIGTTIGIFILAVLNNGLVLLNVQTHWQDVAVGIVMVLAVYMDIVRRRRS